MKFPTIHIFIVKLLCKSIKVMGAIYDLTIGKFFCIFNHKNPGIVKQLLKSLKIKTNIDQNCCEFIIARFCYEFQIELIGNNL